MSEAELNNPGDQAEHRDGRFTIGTNLDFDYSAALAISDRCNVHRSAFPAQIERNDLRFGKRQVECFPDIHERFDEFGDVSL